MVEHIDATVVIERPALAPHSTRMREALAGALGIAPAGVNVKATRGEGTGFIGRGEERRRSRSLRSAHDPRAAKPRGTCNNCILGDFALYAGLISHIGRRRPPWRTTPRARPYSVLKQP